MFRRRYIARSSHEDAFVHRLCGADDLALGLCGYQIDGTYDQLTQIAVKYGATVPRSVVGE